MKRIGISIAAALIVVAAISFFVLQHTSLAGHIQRVANIHMPVLLTPSRQNTGQSSNTSFSGQQMNPTSTGNATNNTTSTNSLNGALQDLNTNNPDSLATGLSANDADANSF